MALRYSLRYSPRSTGCRPDYTRRFSTSRYSGIMRYSSHVLRHVQWISTWKKFHSPDWGFTISNKGFYKERKEGAYKIIDVNMILLT